MIAIVNDRGETLELTPGQNLVTEQVAPWLTDEELPGEFSYPIDAPLHEANKRFVDFGYRPDAALPQSSIPVTAYLNGVMYRRCTYAFRVEQGRLNGYLKLDASEVYDKLRKLTLLEALPDLVDLGDGLRTVNGAPQIISLAERMKQIASLPVGEFPCTFFPLRNEGFFEDSFDNTKLTGFVRRPYVNSWELISGVGHGFRTDSSGNYGNMIVPFFFLSYILTRLMALAGYRIESDWLASEEVQRLVIVNMTSVKNPHGFAAETFGHRIIVGQHLPDMAVSDFLKAIKVRFSLAITYNANDKVCFIRQFVDVVRMGPGLDLTPYQSGSYSTSDPDGRGFSVMPYIDGEDALYKNEKGEVIQPVPFVVGRGEQSIQLKCGTTQQIYETSPLFGAGKWLVPTVRQAGNVLDDAYKLSERYLDEKGQRRNNIGLKLLSYRGMTTDSKGSPYPLGTPDVRDGHQIIVGKQSAGLEGRFGGWRAGLRPYYLFRDRTQKITQPLLLPIAVLSQLKLHESVYLSLESQVLRSYLITRMQAESPGVDGRAIVRLEVQTIPAGIDQAPDYDEPLVWVEWIASPEVGGGIFPRKVTRTYTVRLWQDQAKTQPAVVTSLPLIVRRKRNVDYDRLTDQYRTEYSETQITYLINGQQQVIEADFIVDEVRAVVNDTGDKPNGIRQSLQPDPGEGYTILPI